MMRNFFRLGKKETETETETEAAVKEDKQNKIKDEIALALKEIERMSQTIRSSCTLVPVPERRKTDEHHNQSNFRPHRKSTS